MGDAARKLDAPRMTIAEYLRFENAAETKHEFVDGEVIDMMGASYWHVIINGNASRALWNALRATPCATGTSDLRVRVPRKARYRYPDTFVLCGEPEFDPDATGEPRAVTNPTVIVEVLSPSTAASDRGPKARDYKLIDALRHYLLVAQDRPRVELTSRQPDGTWSEAVAFDGLDAVVPLDALGVTLAFRDVYANVKFDAAAS